MFEQEKIKVLDPLSQHTREMRKLLLAMSLINIAIVTTGLLPTKISALGLDFSSENRSAILLLLSFVTIYFLISFIIYGISDFTNWRLDIIAKAWDEEKEGYESVRKQIVDESKLTPEMLEELREHERRIGAIWRGGFIKYDSKYTKIAKSLSIIRIVLDLGLPLIISIISLWFLFMMKV